MVMLWHLSRQSCDICRWLWHLSRQSCDMCRWLWHFVEAKLWHLSWAVTFVEAKLWHLSLAVTFVEAKLWHLSRTVTFVKAMLWHLSLAVTLVEGCYDICRGLWHLVGLWHLSAQQSHLWIRRYSSLFIQIIVMRMYRCHLGQKNVCFPIRYLKLSFNAICLNNLFAIFIQSYLREKWRWRSIA